MRNIFIDELAGYIASNSSGRFTYGSGDTNLKIGELMISSDGVFIEDGGSPQPDMYLDTEQWSINFFAKNRKTEQAYQDLNLIYQLLHQKLNYDLQTYKVYFSYSLGQPQDMDRDGENRKILKLVILFISRSLIS